MATTLLELTQDILSTMDSDEANSIDDTAESTQVARLIRTVFWDLADSFDLPTNKRLYTLDGLGETTTPTHMQIPERLHSIEWIKYDCRLSMTDPVQYKDMVWMEPKDFVDFCNARNSGADNVEIVRDPVAEPHAAKILILNDKPPQAYTTFDSRHIVFDSYNEDVESTLYEQKSLCYGTFRPTIEFSNGAIIDLPPHLMTLLINETRELAWDIWKDGAPQKISRNANRARVKAQRIKRTLRNNAERDNRLDYGRKPRRITR